MSGGKSYIFLIIKKGNKTPQLKMDRKIIFQLKVWQKNPQF